MIRKGPAVFLLLLGAVFPPGSASAQTESLERILRSNSYVLSETNGQLSGTGFDFLMKASADAQFVAIGEEHFVKQVPEFTTMLFKALHERYNFNYLADESDCVSAQMVSNKPLLSNKKALFAFARKYPNAFTFNSDQEIEMFIEIGRISTGKADRVWGLDQAFGALHILDRLAELAPDKQTRERTLGLAAHARSYEATRYTEGRHYLSQIAKPADFLTLAAWYKARAGSEAEFLIEQLMMSERVYRNFYRGRETKIPGSFENGREREENMKDLFMHNYRNAQAAGERSPKVVLKFGHWHIYRGMYRANIPTLGNFVSEFAKSNGLKSFQLAIALHNKPGGFRAIAPNSFLHPLGDAADIDKWTIFDLRPLRDYVHADKIKVDPALRQMIFGFDAVLLIGQGSRATFKLTEGNN